MKTAMKFGLAILGFVVASGCLYQLQDDPKNISLWIGMIVGIVLFFIAERIVYWSMFRKPMAIHFDGIPPKRFRG